MKTTGRIKNVTRDWDTNNLIISFEINSIPEDLHTLNDCELLDVSAEKHRNRRSRNANALLWQCLGNIAHALNTDKWSVYLKMLKRYGEYTYIVIKPQALDMLKKQWRECEEIGTIDIHGEKAVQVLCYYGSSTYDSKQFSVLLNGVISEMKEIGLEPPTSEEMRRSLEALDGQKETDQIAGMAAR